MVVDRVVEPRRHLEILVARVAEDRRVGEAGLRVQRREVRAIGVIQVVEDVAVGVGVGIVGLVAIDVLSLLVGDDVGGVVGDDIEEDVDITRGRAVDDRFQFRVAAEVGVELGEVGDPVAVVAGRCLVTFALDRVVLEHGRHPDGGDAHAVQVVQLVRQPGQVAAVVEALVGRVKAVVHAVARNPARVVARVAVGKTVRHDEVHHLVLEGVTHRRLDHGGPVDGLRVFRGDGRNVGGGIEAEGHGCAVGHAEGDVVTPGHAACAVVLIPAFIDGDLALVVAGRQRAGGEGVDAVAVDVLQPRAEAIRQPVAGAAQFGLEVARRGGNAAVLVVGDPVGLVVVVELDGRGLGQAQRDVVAAGRRAGAVVLVPTPVERDLVLPVARGQVRGDGPHVVSGVVGHLRCGALGLPVAGTAQFILQTPDQRHACGVVGVVGHRCGRGRGCSRRQADDPAQG